jgi:hypothetical protein
MQTTASSGTSPLGLAPGESGGGDEARMGGGERGDMATASPMVAAYSAVAARGRIHPLFCGAR